MQNRNTIGIPNLRIIPYGIILLYYTTNSKNIKESKPSFVCIMLYYIMIGSTSKQWLPIQEYYIIHGTFLFCLFITVWYEYAYLFVFHYFTWISFIFRDDVDLLD